METRKLSVEKSVRHSTGSSSSDGVVLVRVNHCGTPVPWNQRRFPGGWSGALSSPVALRVRGRVNKIDPAEVNTTYQLKIPVHDGTKTTLRGMVLRSERDDRRPPLPEDVKYDIYPVSPTTNQSTSPGRWNRCAVEVNEMINSAGSTRQHVEVVGSGPSTCITARCRTGDPIGAGPKL